MTKNKSEVLMSHLEHCLTLLLSRLSFSPPLLSGQPSGAGGGGEVLAGAAAGVSLLRQEVYGQEAGAGFEAGDQPVLHPLPALLELEQPA